VPLIVSLPLSSLGHQLRFDETSGAAGITVFFGRVGVMVARRQPRNLARWIPAPWNLRKFRHSRLG
jgi:hypothetical protein